MPPYNQQWGIRLTVYYHHVTSFASLRASLLPACACTGPVVGGMRAQTY